MILFTYSTPTTATEHPSGKVLVEAYYINNQFNAIATIIIIGLYGTVPIMIGCCSIYMVSAYITIK